MNILEQALVQSCNIAIADLIYKPTEKALYAGEEKVLLEPRNLALLEMLLMRVGQPTSIEEFIESVWESQYVSKNVVTNRISLLRTLFRQHSQHGEPTEILVTYPKRGYYLAESHVRMLPTTLETAPFNQDVHQSQKAKNKRFRTSYVALAISFLIIAVMSIVNINKNDNTVVTTPYYPQVNLLLDVINYQDDQLVNLSRKLKTLLLYSQSRFPYTKLSNMSSPSYYLDNLLVKHQFPGSTVNSDSDYHLSFNLWQTDQGIVKLETMLHHSSSGRAAWRKVYQAYPSSLTDTVNQINSDLSQYFKLPAPIKPLSSKLLSSMNPDTPPNIEALSNRELSIVELQYYTRQLLFTDIDNETLKKWIEIVKRNTSTPIPDLYMQLALLAFQNGEKEQSKRILQNEYINDIPDNALALMMRANLAKRNGNSGLFVSDYLKTMSALTSTVQPEKVFLHYSRSDRQKACEKLWQDALPKVNLTDTTEIGSSISMFCDMRNMTEEIYQ